MSRASSIATKPERPSHIISVPPTVAALRRFSGASSFSAGAMAFGISINSRSCCSLTVAPIASVLPLLEMRFSPSACKSTTSNILTSLMREDRTAAKRQGHRRRSLNEPEGFLE